MVTKIMVVVVVANTEFIAVSKSSIQALETANLLKNMAINAIILGPSGVGKTVLAKNIVEADVFSGENLPEIIDSMHSNKSIIIKNFHKITNLELFKKITNETKSRIIATSSHKIDKKILDTFFGFNIKLSPLKDRMDDVKELAKKIYLKAMFMLFNQKDVNFDDLENINYDLSNNAYSLRYSIYKYIFIKNFNEDDIMNILENNLKHKIGTGDDYKKQLYLFEVPLFRAGIKKFNSQLAISQNFGLHRNTIRKKISELQQYL